MTTATKQKRLKELTKERNAQEKRFNRLGDEIANLKGQLAKKEAQLNTVYQQLSLTNNKFSDLSSEISAEIAQKNKEY